jgi:hypothetical protein
MDKPALQKVDRRKQLAKFYTAKATPKLVDVPPLDYLMIDGVGDPDTSADFAAAIEALYGVSYTIKFALRIGPAPIDYAVMPLEGLWWADDSEAFERGERKAWKWTLMIVQPPGVTAADVKDAIAMVRAKKPHLSSLDALRLKRWAEGPSAQLLHIGPYASERQSIQRLHAHIAATRSRMRGKHHEIYLNDATRTAPQRLKTIIRQPVSRERG